MYLECCMALKEAEFEELGACAFVVTQSRKLADDVTNFGRIVVLQTMKAPVRAHNVEIALLRTQLGSGFLCLTDK